MKLATLLPIIALGPAALAQVCSQGAFPSQTSGTLLQFGDTVALGPDYVVVASTGDDVAGSGSGAVEVFSIDPVNGRLVPGQVLRVNDPGVVFGFGLALDADGDTLVIGAPYDLGGAVGFPAAGGAVYVFARTAGVWRLEQKLTPSDATTSDGFGSSVAIDGDRLVVARSNRFSSQAYVFERTASGWVETGILGVATSALSVDNRVDIDGDVVVCGGHSGTIHRYDPQTFSWVQEDTFDARPDGLVSLDGSLLAVGGPDSVRLRQRSSTSSAWDVVTQRSFSTAFAVRRPRAVSLGGSDLFVTVEDDPTQFGQWAVQRLRLTGTGLELVSEMTEGQNGVTSRDEFGESLAFRGTRAIAGVPTLNDDVGGVFVYDTTCDIISTRQCRQTALNSTGATGRLDVTGSRAVAVNDVTLVASLLPPGATSFFLVSRGFTVSPMPGGSQGTLCMGGDIGRFVGPGQIQNSGPAGSASLRIDLTAVPFATGAQGVLAGDFLYFQAWHRDANPNPTSNFTDVGVVRFE